MVHEFYGSIAFITFVRVLFIYIYYRSKQSRSVNPLPFILANQLMAACWQRRPIRARYARLRLAQRGQSAVSTANTITTCSSLERKSGSIFQSAKLVFIKPHFYVYAVKFFP